MKIDQTINQAAQATTVEQACLTADSAPVVQGRLLIAAIPFDPAGSAVVLASLPDTCGVFALFADDPDAEPYLAKTSHLRRRLQRFLKPAPTQTRRLQLAERIRRIEYTETGSDFASDIVLYRAAREIETLHGGRGRSAERRLRLKPAAFLRLGSENRFPRAFITTKPGRAVAAQWQPVGPFPSKAATERFLEDVLDLFLLRRCVENLSPDPSHPGCAYSEMKKCLAPCYGGCTEERYRQEAIDVQQFLVSRGKSLLEAVELERRKASDELEFEQAAVLHQRFQKIEALAAQMPEAARAVSGLSGVIVQPGSRGEHVDLFALACGALSGPVRYSTLGMRLHNELSGSSSLYTQPMALQPVPLVEGVSKDEAAEQNGPAREAKASPASRAPEKDMLEARLDQALAGLGISAAMKISPKELENHFSLFARWFYRPRTRRTGEVVFVDDAGEVPRRPLLRAISRVAAMAQFAPQIVGHKPSQWHA